MSKKLSFIVIFTIILGYKQGTIKDWAGTLKHMLPHVDVTVLHVGTSDIVWYVDYSIDLSL